MNTAFLSANRETTNEQCPLCSSSDVATLELVPGSLINRMYGSELNIKDALSSTVLGYCSCHNCGLVYFSPLETGDNRFYEQLQQFEWYYMSDKAEFHVAMKSIPSNATVLEVGAGKADFSKLVGKERYSGLEFNDLAIKRARDSGITLIKESVEDHAAAGHHYDAVVSFQVLEHVRSPNAFIKACVDCLNPKGRLILAVPSQDGFVGKALNNILNMPPHHVTRWTDKTLRVLATMYKLDLLSIEHEPVAPYHQEWARTAIVEARIRKFIGLRARIVDQRFGSRVISKVSRLIDRVIPVSLDGVKGHTVTACYQLP